MITQLGLSRRLVLGPHMRWNTQHKTGSKRYRRQFLRQVLLVSIPNTSKSASTSLRFVCVFVCLHSPRKPFYPILHRYRYISFYTSREVGISVVLYWSLYLDWHQPLEVQPKTETYNNKEETRIQRSNFSLHSRTSRVLLNGGSREPSLEEKNRSSGTC